MITPNPFNNERKDGSCAWRITLSEHEWKWTQEEQEEMARVIIQLSAALTEAESIAEGLSDEFTNGERKMPWEKI